MAVQKILCVGVDVGLSLVGFQWLPRTTLALLAVLSALVAVALINHTVLLILR